MGKRNKTKITVLSVLCFIYSTVTAILLFVSPYYIRTWSPFYKLSITVDLRIMTFFLGSAIFDEKYSLVCILAYGVSFISLIVSWICIICRKRQFYAVFLFYFIVEFVFRIVQAIQAVQAHRDFDWLVFAIALAYELIGSILYFALLLKTKRTKSQQKQQAEQDVSV